MKYILWLLFTFSVCFPLTVDEILDKSEANENFSTSASINIEEVYNSDGSVKLSRIKAYAKNGSEKTLMEYTEPKRIQGMKILMLNKGDDIWFYSNRTNRVRKIASHQKNQSANNSDFSYEDMSMSDNRKDYTYKLAGKKIMKVKAVIRSSLKLKADRILTVNSVFGSINLILWLSAENSLMRKELCGKS